MNDIFSFIDKKSTVWYNIYIQKKIWHLSVNRWSIIVTPKAVVVIYGLAATHCCSPFTIYA